MKKLFIATPLVAIFLISIFAGCSFVEPANENPMDPESPWFVGYEEAALIYARATQTGEPLALEEAAGRLEGRAVASSGDTARNFKKTAYLLRELASNRRDSWDPSPY